MAIIITFPSSSRPDPALVRPAGADMAEILFFTGVRIERHSDALPDAPKAARPSIRPNRAPRKRSRGAGV